MFMILKIVIELDNIIHMHLSIGYGSYDIEIHPSNVHPVIYCTSLVMV